MTFRSLAPALLLAAPRLQDPYFERTVVLLGRHEEDGALGWILNGSSLHPVGDLLRSVDLAPRGATLLESDSLRRAARVGGPVRPESGWLLYRSEVASFEGELEVDRLAVCSNPDAVRAVLRGDEPHDFRFFLGYAGWGPGQLEAEMREGVWFPGSLDADLIFDESTDDLWEAAFRQSTGAWPSHLTQSKWGLA